MRYSFYLIKNITLLFNKRENHVWVVFVKIYVEYQKKSLVQVFGYANKSVFFI